MKKRREKVDKIEVCVICGEKTDCACSTSIQERDCYVEGAGQLCPNCYSKIYHEDKLNQDYIFAFKET